MRVVVVAVVEVEVFETPFMLPLLGPATKLVVEEDAELKVLETEPEVVEEAIELAASV